MQRRSFMKMASLTAVGSTAGLAQFGGLSALAETSSQNDYKALVCVLLNGGNDPACADIETDGSFTMVHG